MPILRYSKNFFGVNFLLSLIPNVLRFKISFSFKKTAAEKSGPKRAPRPRTGAANAPLSLGAGDSAVRFQCYDLGGQYKSYAAAQQAYVARGALYLLVVSAEAASSADDEGRLRWWLPFLQTHAPGAVVQMLGGRSGRSASGDAMQGAAASVMAATRVRKTGHDL